MGYVVEQIKSTEEATFLLIVDGTGAMATLVRLSPSEGTATEEPDRWRVTVRPEEGCRLEPFSYNTKMVTARAAAEQSAQEFHERMTGKDIQPPRRARGYLLATIEGE